VKARLKEYAKNLDGDNKKRLLMIADSAEQWWLAIFSNKIREKLDRLAADQIVVGLPNGSFVVM
jgi:hypothetical protein